MERPDEHAVTVLGGDVEGGGGHDQPDGPTWLWLNGAVLPAEQARVAALDHGITVGDGVFETMKVIGGRPFALGRHLRRLRRSAAALDLTVPLDDRQLASAVEEAVAAVERDVASGQRPVAGRVRITVTGGPGPLGSDRFEVPATVLVAASPAPPWPLTTAVATVPWVRNERGALAGVKSTSYAENVKALTVAHRAGASEAIFANTVGALCEGTGSNVFVVIDGRLLTPTLASGCLAGITRELLLEMVEATETDGLRLGDLALAEEAFLTSSTRDVQAIANVDGVALPTPCPGPFTRAATEAFAALQERHLDP